ncbi:transcription factor LBX2 [Chlamydotis macqueenii]
MTSAREAAGSPPLHPPGGGRRDQLPPPASSNKPLTPFGIEDILGRPRGGSPPGPGPGPGPAAPPAPLPAKAAGAPGRAPASPLCALEELASKTFRGLELGLLQAAEGRAAACGAGQRAGCRRRRKARTAFTPPQLAALEQRFRRHRYLSPAERDGLAARLALSAGQVLTWFQNRRAKLRRDLRELRADLASLRALPPAALRQLAGPPAPPRPAEPEEEEIDPPGGGGEGEKRDFGRPQGPRAPPPPVTGGSPGVLPCARDPLRAARGQGPQPPRAAWGGDGAWSRGTPSPPLTVASGPLPPSPGPTDGQRRAHG